MSTHYQYIITGAGCAGSSLLMRMMQEDFFSDKRILVIDQEPKTQDDHTWCFWEKGQDIFEPVVHHQWQQLNFFSENFSSSFSIAPYRYKMIRSSDLYELVKQKANGHANIEWLYEPVTSLQNENGRAVVNLASGRYTADYVFNSILFETPIAAPGHVFLWQHFTGWVIETKDVLFDPSAATLMDFRISQEQDTAFMYVLPTSPSTALVEYTLFSEELLSKEAYEIALREYISSRMGIRNYAIHHTEYGKIPMTDMAFPRSNGRIIHIGTAGGDVKGSSGYAFRFIQKRTQHLVAAMTSTGVPGEQKPAARFRLYDSIFLNVLQKKSVKGDEIFSRLFKKNPPATILRFLDNETGPVQEIAVIRSLPTIVFLKAAWQVFIKGISRQ